VDLYIIPSYDPRFSRVASPAVRYPRPLEPMLEGAQVPSTIYLLDEAGQYQSAASYTVTAGIYQNGSLLAAATASSVTTGRFQYTYTLSLASVTLGTAVQSGAITAAYVVTVEGATDNQLVLAAPVSILPAPSRVLVAPSTTPTPADIVDALDVGTLPINDTYTLERSATNRVLTVRGEVAIGTGAYTTLFILDTDTAQEGDKVYITLTIPLSTNPTIEFRSEGVGSAFATCEPDGVATTYFGAFTFVGGAWSADQSTLV
jgi:hypothetical protein